MANLLHLTVDIQRAEEPSQRLRYSERCTNAATCTEDCGEELACSTGGHKSGKLERE